MTSVSIVLSVGNNKIPVDSFRTTGGAYGSTGHGEFTTSRRMLLALGINLIKLSSQSPANLEVDLSVQVGNGGFTRIFGGEYIDAVWSYDTDGVTIHARDWSGVLVDQKKILPSQSQTDPTSEAPLAPGQVLPSNISTQNQRISQIVTQIAKQYGFTPVLNFQTGNDDTDPYPGTIYGSDDSGLYLSMPQNLWAVLNQFARDTGYEVYVTPTKQLVFGNPGQGITPQTLSYNISPVPDGAIPCKGLKVFHHPRRNSTFRVLILSYDPLRAQLVTGRADNIGINFPAINPGIYSGQDAINTDAQLSASGLKIPVYTFHIDGLTQAQAQSKATAICADIAKRELYLQCTVDGFPPITPTQKINIVGNVDDEVSGNNFYVNSFDHSFSMPKNDRGASGFMTTLKALDIPVQANGAEAQA